MKNHRHVDEHEDPFNTFPVLSNISCFVDHSKHFGIFSAFRHFSKLARTWLSIDNHRLRNPNLFTQFHRFRHSNNLNFAGALFSINNLFKRSSDDILSLAISPPDQRPCDVKHQTDFNRVTRAAVEPVTGIEFPGTLNNVLANQNQSNLSSEVLVGTGSRTVTIIKIKSLKVYAFGFYVHPYNICQKLGSKYASISAAELKDHNDFYADLLREDIGMTLRLVVNCNGMKINAVKDAFEKSLRDRLVKTNPETDFKCIATFGSFFTKDIPLPVGTIIDFKRTADGRLITEIGGNQIGAVHSRELCRAFFDMYLGEVPVSKQTKEEIGSNVATIVRRC